MAPSDTPTTNTDGTELTTTIEITPTATGRLIRKKNDNEEAVVIPLDLDEEVDEPGELGRADLDRLGDHWVSTGNLERDELAAFYAGQEDSAAAVAFATGPSIRRHTL